MDPQAQLADDVEVGPCCIIQGKVTVGKGTRLHSQVNLQGPLTLGEHNTIYPGVCIGFAPQHRAFDHDEDGAGTVIGDRNVFREMVTIHRAYLDKPTTIGSDNYFMAQSHVGHDCVVGSHCTLANGGILGGHAIFNDHAILGGHACVHQFCRVGRMAMVGGTGGVTQDLPPYCVAYDLRVVGALNLVGLRRAGLREHVQPLKRAFDLLYRSGHSNPEAIKHIEAELGDNPLCMEFADFVRTSTRGITSYQPHRDQRAE